MQNLATLSLFALALTFAGGSLKPAHSQALQSDGTMSQPQQPAAPAPPMGHAPNSAHQLKKMTRTLGLTPDQSAKVQPILADRDARMAALHGDATLDPKSMHKQGHAIELDTQAKINAVLTPAQQQLYSEMRAAHHKGSSPVAPPTA